MEVLTNMNNTQTDKATYTLADVGCYVDGARGIYAIDKILCIAEDHGKVWGDELFSNDDPNDKTYSDEAEDIATDYMNTYCAVEGAYWGRSEQGDWGLWTIDES